MAAELDNFGTKLGLSSMGFVRSYDGNQETSFGRVAERLYRVCALQLESVFNIQL